MKIYNTAATKDKECGTVPPWYHCRWILSIYRLIASQIIRISFFKFQPTNSVCFHCFKKGFCTSCEVILCLYQEN